MSSLLEQAQAGVQQEEREHWRRWRMENCGKPNSWIWNMQAKKKTPNIWDCNESECERCRQIRADKEEARIKRAIDEHKRVCTLYCTNLEWSKLLRKFASRGITKDSFRRLPLVEGNAVFFVSNDLDFVESLDAETMTESKPPMWTEQADWYELARKKPGKRTSGNLGGEDDPKQQEGYESYQVSCVYAEGVTMEHETQAEEIAEKLVKDDEPRTHEEAVDICARWADAYEAKLQQLGYPTRQTKVWRRWNLTSFFTKKANDVKSPTSYALSRQLAQEYLYPRETTEI